jgi:hypothetical protein
VTIAYLAGFFALFALGLGFFFALGVKGLGAVFSSRNSTSSSRLRTLDMGHREKGCL